LPWLTTAGHDATQAAFAALDAAEPRRLAARLAWLRGGSALTRGAESLVALAADAGAAIAHPLLDRGVWAAIARAAPNGGYLGRTHAMKALFGALLPNQVLERSDKAGFDEVFFARHSRALAAAWNGEGAPADLVHLGRLRAHWAAPNPQAQSFTLLQAAFLASSPQRVEQQGRSVRERFPAAGATQAPHRQ
jgi:asparagine synthase (glutamine-hydrolysing)